MSYELPISLPHITTVDAEELTRLLRAVFKDSVDGANKWLQERSGVFNCPPLELLKRDELGVVRVIDYLKDCAL